MASNKNQTPCWRSDVLNFGKFWLCDTWWKVLFCTGNTAWNRAYLISYKCGQMSKTQMFQDDLRWSKWSRLDGFGRPHHCLAFVRTLWSEVSVIYVKYKVTHSICWRVKNYNFDWLIKINTNTQMQYNHAFPPKIEHFEFFEINKYFFLNEMIFIYLFYVIGRTDCQLTKGHILEWMLYGVLWGFSGEWWFIGGQNLRIWATGRKRKYQRFVRLCNVGRELSKDRLELHYSRAFVNPPQ